MNAVELLRSLRDEGVQLWCEGDKLRYRAPKGRLAPGVIEALASCKPQIVELLRRPPAAGPCFQASSRPAASPRENPLSFAQQRMWFLRQLGPESCALNVPLGFRLSGKLDVTALQRSLSDLVARHEAFRTTCAIKDGVPVQVIAPPGEACAGVTVFDLRPTRESEREAELQRLANIEAKRPFDLERLPLLRSALFQLAEDRWALVLSTHHFVVDGWSVGVLFRDLSALYNAQIAKRPPDLERISLRYCDYALWQRERLKGTVLDELLAYWKKQLDSVTEVNLPSDRPSISVRSGGGAILRFELPGDLSAALRALSRREGVTLYMALLAAFKTLLHRYSRQDDIVVGTAVSDRCMAETQALVGCFANTLVLRTGFEGNPPFNQLLRRVRDSAVGAFDHQDLPYEILVEHLRPERPNQRDPLLRAWFVLHQYDDDQALRLNGVTTCRLPVELDRTTFDFLLDLQDERDRLSGFLEYSTDLFDEATVRRMVGHFKNLLEGIVADPSQPVSRLPMLTESERHQVLVEWNRASASFQRDKCIHEVFEEQVERTPGAAVALFGDETLTYRELNMRANRLAQKLRTLGVGPDVLVGLCIERSIEMVIGVLGILKAGGAYVPLDPTYPQERLRFMLSDAQAPVLLTQERLRPALPETRATVVCLDGDWHRIAAGRTEDPPPAMVATRPTNLAYVIYTSGSTGMPKGVAMPHGPLVNLIEWQKSHSKCGEGDRTLQFASLSFDVSFQEMFSTLSTGGTLVVAPEGARYDPQTLWRSLVDGAVNRVFLPPMVLDYLAQAAEISGSNAESLREVITAGEQLRLTPSIRRLFQRLRGCDLVNQYGPTETHVVTAWRACPEAESWPVLPPIGRPIDNARIYILDRSKQPVPVGVPGEIHIGGSCLARGYHNRPELTDEKFVPDTFDLRSNSRLYRTGDLARYLPDGNIEFIGRADHQVKIRGFRIEPGEVEAVLGRHTNVDTAVVVAREDEPGERQLVAYIVPRNGNAPHDWRTFLRGKLPAYMIPSAFVELEALPMTASGKVDRRALPRPQCDASEDSSHTQLTPTEEIVRSVWAKVLHVDDFGVQTGFFELGGHSLLAMQAVLELRRILQVELPVTALFEHPTVSAFSCHINELVAQNLETVRPPIERVSRDRLLPLSFGQERLWRNERLTKSAENIYVIVLEVRGDLNIPCLERSFQELVRRHEVLRTTVHAVGDSPAQRIAPYRPFELSVVDLSHAPDAEAEATRFALREKMTRLDFERGPLARFSVLRFANDHHRVVLTFHHILYDIWSLPILFKELNLLYTAFCLGKESPLPELKVQLADFAVWQRRYFAPGSSAFRAQIAYWREQLSENLPTLRLPCERSGELKTASMDDVPATFEISEELSAAIRSITKREGTTLFITFLTALKALINLTTDQDDIMLGTYLAKRSAPESDSMMGCFCDLSVLRTRVSSDLSFLELLSRVRETVLKAHAYEDMPFNMLEEELRKCGQAAPDLRAIFAFETFSGEAFRLGDLEVKQLPVAVKRMPWRFQMCVRDTKGKLSGFANFDARLHDPQLVRRMMRNYLRLVEAAVAKPAARLCEVEEELGSW